MKSQGGSGQITPDHIDFAWKIIIGGNGGVGKSTLIHRYVYKEFKDNTAMTIGCSHHSQYIERYGKTINLILWDLGGQDRFQMLHPAYATGASAGYVCFDMAAIGTLTDIDKWVQLIRKFNKPSTPVLLVGTKYDLMETQEQLDSICALANEKVAALGIDAFMVTSSKMNVNVEETITYMIDYLLWKNGGS
nr:Rab family GTPase [Candidatus Sigynarchaeum springense]